MANPVLLGVSLKLYLDVARSTSWALDVAHLAREHPAVASGGVRLFVMPSFPALAAVRTALDDSRVELGAQDLHGEDRGAYTGAVSGQDLRQVGCTLVEVGHAERRRMFGDDDGIVARKLAAAFRNGLTPVLCVGERAAVSPSQAAVEVIAQLDSALHGLGEVHLGAELIVAYEPEWAIGTSEAAGHEHVSVVSSALRERLALETPLRRAMVVYGGSAQRGTLGELRSAVDGLFLGRFAHDVRMLEEIVDEASALV